MFKKYYIICFLFLYLISMQSAFSGDYDVLYYPGTKGTKQLFKDLGVIYTNKLKFNPLLSEHLFEMQRSDISIEANGNSPKFFHTDITTGNVFIKRIRKLDSYGLFAGSGGIKKGQVIGVYSGEVFYEMTKKGKFFVPKGLFAFTTFSSTQEIMDHHREWFDGRNKGIYCHAYLDTVPVNRMGTETNHIKIDASKYGNEMRFINHSHASENVTRKIAYVLTNKEKQLYIPVMLFTASKDIRQGEQILYDYDKFYWSNMGEKPLDLDDISVPLSKYNGCHYCGNGRKKMKACGRCKKALYCNRNCQKLDWKNRHKRECS